MYVGFGCGSHPGQTFGNLIEQAVEGCPKRGGAMPKMVIEVPEQFLEVGKGDGRTPGSAAADCRSSGWGEGGGLCSGRSGDRGRSVQDRISSPQSNLEEFGHGCSSSGDRRGSVHAGGTVRGGLPHDGGFGIGGAIVVPAIGTARRTAWGKGGGCC